MNILESNDYETFSWAAVELKIRASVSVGVILDFDAFSISHLIRHGKISCTSLKKTYFASKSKFELESRAKSAKMKTLYTNGF